VKYSILWVSTLFLFFGCATKQYQKSEQIILTLKTTPLKFSDQAYFRKDATSVELELFSAGVAVEKFNIEDKICTNAGCISKSDFNAKYLSPFYEDDILKMILLGRPIFNGRNLVRTADGFEQSINRVFKYNIIYRVNKKKIYFKDRARDLLVKIQKL